MADDERNRSTVEPETFGDGRFFSILSELAERHTQSALAYGIHNAEDHGFSDDPLASMRFAAPDFGIEPWVYALMRANENMRRLQAEVLSADPSNPQLRKAFLDLASQALLALIFFEEEAEFIANLDDDD